MYKVGESAVDLVHLQFVSPCISVMCKNRVYKVVGIIGDLVHVVAICQGRAKSAECRKATLCPTLPGGPLCPAKKGVRRGAGESPSVALGIAAASPAGYGTFCLNFPEALLSRASAILRSVPKKPGFSGRTTRKRWRERLRTELP